MGAVGRMLTEEAVPPHSGPQFRMYAELPSAEKMAFTGRSKVSGLPVFGSCTWARHMPGRFLGSQST
jgi:hypothetical protein